MSNTDPRSFDFTEQTAAHNLSAALGDTYPSWSAWAADTGQPTWQMGWDVDDMTVALRRGYSPYGIQQLEQEARKRGLRIGPNAITKLNQMRTDQPEAFNAPIDYGARGGYGFDTSDIASMWGAGVEDMTSPAFTEALEKVRDAWMWAQDQNLPNSRGIDTWFQHKENQQRTAIEAKYQQELIAQQQAAAAEQARIAEAAAAQAARVKGNRPTGVGGAASIKGSRLSITEGKGRKGTKQFSRPTEYLNTLGIQGGGGVGSVKQTLTM